MKSPTFISSLAPAMSDFVALKRAAGYKYEKGVQRLSRFDRYLHEQQFQESVLSKEILMGYQTALLSTGPYARYTRMVVAGAFTRYYQRVEPQSAVIAVNPFKHPKPTLPYIYTFDDINILLQTAMALKPVQSIKSHVFTTLIALLHITGMRISEALHLTLKDVHHQPNRLFISKSKFDKDRWLVLRDSTASALKSYMVVRQRFAPEEPDEPLFLNQKGAALSYNTAQSCFRELLKKCLIGTHWQGASPRLHGLRHTFATNSLLQDYRQGNDPNRKLPYLITYMGHGDLVATKTYLHTTPQLMEFASQRFHDYVYSLPPTSGADDD